MGKKARIMIQVLGLTCLLSGVLCVLPGIEGNVLEVQASTIQSPIVNGDGNIIERSIVIHSQYDMDSWMQYKQTEPGQEVARTITDIQICVENSNSDNNSITIPETAFYGFPNLQRVSISEVTNIGDQAFQNCPNLSSVTFSGTIPPTLGKQVFYGDASRIVEFNVPPGSETAYDNALSALDSNRVNQLGQSGFSINNIITHSPQSGVAGGNLQPSAGNMEQVDSAICNHNWEQREYVEANAVEDAIVVPVCTKCGLMGSYVRLPGSAQLSFLIETVQKITNAEPNANVIANSEIWLSMNRLITDALTVRKDVSLTLNYKYEGKYYTLTIPAGYKAETLLDENGWAGFRYIDSILPGRELTEEEWKNLKNNIFPMD